MYQTKVTLIGFLGSSAEARNNGSFTALSWRPSPPTKRTACIPRTRNGTVALYSARSRSSPKRSLRAHISRSKANYAAGYDSKKTESRQRIWEIRVSSILTLDRTEKSAPEDQDVEPREDIVA